MALFLLLALAMSAAFIVGTTKAFSGGWRDAVKPLLSDYVDRLATSIGSPPDVEKAQALVKRLPIAVRIEGPVTQFDSHPERQMDKWQSGRQERDNGSNDAGRSFLKRTTPDGHTITFGMGNTEWRRGPGAFGWLTLAMLLGLTAAAFIYVRRLFKPLDDINAGVQRFGAGNFGQSIVVARNDELGELAGQINTMGQEIASMLDAKRALLLAISHELRSPLTRARLNTELLPDQPESKNARNALVRDLSEMGRLITDLLESERLSGNHTTLQQEPSDLGKLVHEVVADVTVAGAGGAPLINMTVDPGLPLVLIDRVRIKLLLRNLLDNAQRHGRSDTAMPIEVSLRRMRAGVQITVRDHGAGIPQDQMQQLGQAFFRPDAARQRSTGGVGLGLYLCNLVAKAHGSALVLENAHPGLQARIELHICGAGGPSEQAGHTE
jgi:signal transduction histidine kinase